jgi:sporulation protein YlmC with PRC-barrel domain
MNRLEGPLDGLLHLMDRQVVDADGLMVCKCDDLELVVREDDTLAVTALLVGVPVWVPRLGEWLNRRWRRLGAAQGDRHRPYRIDLSEIERVTQEIRLRHGRAGVLQRQDPREAAGRRRVGDLLGAEVIGPGEEHLGDVLDVRLEPDARAGDPALVLTSLVVGRGRPGSYLGYDRSAEHGPWLVKRVVCWLHRHSGMVEAEAIENIDWGRRHVSVSTGLGELTHAGTTGEPERDR